MIPEFLDEAEDVIPAAAVQSGGMIAQLVENLVHLERRGDGFDQHGGANRALGYPDVFLREHEHVVPQARFLVALHLRQIEIRAGAEAICALAL